MKLREVRKLLMVLWFLPVVLALSFSPSTLKAAEDEEETRAVIEEELPPGEMGGGLGDRLFFIADVTAFFTESNLNGSGSSEGLNLNGLFAPVYQFNDRTFFILMYDGQYYKKREFYSDDIGQKQRNEFQAHTVQPMVRFDFGERARYSVTPLLFHTATYNKDVDTDSWGDGLYNYRDYGAGVDFDMRRVYGDEGAVQVALQYYEREYPNYASLLSLTGLDLQSGNNAERNEKDYSGILGRIGYRWRKTIGFSWETEYSLLHKMLDDKKVVNSVGVLTSEEQEDYVHSFDLNLMYNFDIGGGLKLGLDLNGTWYDSNQNYYDGMQTVTPADNTPINDYYDYFSYRIRPNISYTFPLFPLTPSLYYSYYKLEYDERKARLAGGIYPYGTEAHYEEQDEFLLRLRYDLTDNWALLAQWQNVTPRSNNEDQRTYRYEYTINNYSLGVSFKY